MLWVNRTEETEGISLPLSLIRLPVYDLHLTLSLLFLLYVFVYNNLTTYVYVKEGRPSVGYGSLHMHELSSRISISDRKNEIVDGTRKRERDAQTDSSVKSLLSPQSVCAWPWE
jgi:hypothetical protein